MMDMQEVKERKRAHPSAGTASLQEDALDQQEEVDPDVAVAASLLGEERAKKPRSALERGVFYLTDRFWPAVFFIVASLGLYELEFVQEVLYARHSNRLFVNLFIWCSTLVMLFACYIEVYRNLVLGEKVTYATAKTSTHGMLISMILAGTCFIIGMWPVWHWLTVPYLFMWFWGIIVQTVVIFPVQIQRVLFAGAYLWFMHSYLSLFVV